MLVSEEDKFRGGVEIATLIGGVLLMKLYKTLNTITAVGTLMNGVFYLIIPGFSLFLLGQSTNPIGLMNTRVAGACALGLCVINWTSRNVIEKNFQRMIAGGNLLMFALLVFVEIHGTLEGAINWVGWAFLLADSSLGLGYTIFLIRSYRHSP